MTLDLPIGEAQYRNISLIPVQACPLHCSNILIISTWPQHRVPHQTLKIHNTIYGINTPFLTASSRLSLLIPLCNTLFSRPRPCRSHCVEALILPALRPCRPAVRESTSRPLGAALSEWSCHNEQYVQPQSGLASDTGWPCIGQHRGVRVTCGI